MPAPLRDVPQAAVELIKSFEGIPDGDPGTVRIDAYLCPAGVWTIGWGHALVDGGAQLKGAEKKARARQLYPGGITRDQAEALLRADLIPRAAAVSSLLKVAVSDDEFGALMALVFNIGAANLGASTLMRKLNAGDKTGAADQFLAWDKARVNGVLQTLAGLTRRRKAERALFLGQDWRAVAATRGRPSLAVLPVPAMPEEDRKASRAANRLAQGSKAPAAPKAVKPRGRTTTPTAPPPPRTATPKAPQKAR